MATNQNRLAMLLLALLSSSALAPACRGGRAAEECFVDEHCPADMVCMAGQCELPRQSTGVEDVAEKLDVGNGIGNAMTCEAVSFTATNAGCEFWAVDLPTSWNPSSPYSLSIATELQFAVVVANISQSEVAEVSVFAGSGSRALKEAMVGPLNTHAFMLPNTNQIDPTRNNGGQAFRIESDVPITAYQFQPLDNLRPVGSSDATSLFPAHVLQTDYIAVTELGIELNVYPKGWDAVSVPAGAYVAVVATENDTHVDFVPTDVLADGAWQGVVLNRGDTFTIISDPSNGSSLDGSLAGTRVISDEPVAVFSGNISASVPATTTECCADHVEHQLLPTVAWGTRYVVLPPPDPTTSANHDPAVIRLVGAYDGTSLVYPAGRPQGAPDSLDAHQDIEFATNEPVIIEAADGDEPFLAAQYLYNSGEANPGSKLGDPAMIVVPSLEQLMDRYVFLVPHGYSTNVVTIVAPNDAEIIVDGRPVGELKEVGDSGGVTWAYTRVEVASGAHVVVADVPVGITIVGYDDFVSYAYAGGSAVELIHEAPPVP